MTSALNTAPDFSLPADTGETITLSVLKGGPVVLFFYPRDDTPGCTKESIGFSTAMPEFAALGAQVFGLSKDSLASHGKFRAKHALTVPLLSDEDGQACEDYGVWKEKNMYGKKFMGIERATFLINTEGQITQSWNKVKVEGHVDEVLAAVRAL